MRGSGVPGGKVELGLVASGNRPLSRAPIVAGAERLRRRARHPGQVTKPSWSGLALIELWHRGHRIGGSGRVYPSRPPPWPPRAPVLQWDEDLYGSRLRALAR